jgi:hypothetical protein
LTTNQSENESVYIPREHIREEIIKEVTPKKMVDHLLLCLLFRDPFFNPTSL